jgi:hypothetical protein
MGFINVNSNEFEIIFTEDGLNAMISKGLISEIKSVGLWDDNIIYTLDTEKQPVPDITGNRNNYTTIKFNLRNPLKNG